MNTAEGLIRELPQGLIRWYEFREHSEKLFVTGGIEECEVLAEVFPEADRMALAGLGAPERRYDYVIGAGIVDRSPAPEKTLDQLKRHLKKDGTLLLFAENRLAIKHFCGEKDYYSGKVFDGVENYVRFSKEAQELAGGREYSKAELRVLLEGAGFHCRFFSVFPNLIRPQLIVADDYMPGENLDIRIFPQYRFPDTVFLEEERLYDDLAANGLLHGMANGFFIECTVEETEGVYNQITVSPDRGRMNGLATILKKNRTVVKRPLFSEGLETIRRIYENQEYLKARRIPMVDMKLEGGVLKMPLIEGETALMHFRKLFRENIQELLRELERFWEYIKMSSEHVDYEEMNWEQFEPGWEKRKEDDPTREKWKKLAEGSWEQREEIGVVLKRGYVDLVALNCFYLDGEFLFYDQESYLENFPAKAILLRTIDAIYMRQPGFREIYPMEDMLDHFGLRAHAAEWRKFAWKFLEPLRNERLLSDYHRKNRRDYYVVNANRHRMNYSQERYEKYFGNIFKNVSGRQVYLFGAGRYTKWFLNKYGRACEIAGLLDNDPEKWGGSYEGLEIFAPEKLRTLKAPYKVLICIKNYQDVLDQLLNMGVREIAVFDPNLDYELPERRASLSEAGEIAKKYAVGYVAGVFDLFHVGHLNLLRRAKEQCGYLIVGVVSDEQVMKEKKTMPVISFEERLEIVRACRYVDEAVEIPIGRPSTKDAYRMYRFDAQFSGSDYENDPSWLSQRTYLRQHGSDLVFFPYTSSVSSTDLKHQLKREEKPE